LHGMQEVRGSIPLSSNFYSLLLEWRNWYTRWSQKPFPFRGCGFESHLQYQKEHQHFMNQKKNHHMEVLAHLLPEMKSLLQEGRPNLLKDLLTDISPLDLADSWYHFSADERLKIFKLLDTQPAMALFEGLELDDQMHLVKALEESRVARVLESIPSKDVAEIFHQLPETAVKKMVSLVQKEGAVEKIKLLMTFEPDTAGSLLYPEFIKLHPQMTSGKALRLLQSVSRANRKKHLRSLYVTSGEGQLLGGVSLEELILAPPHTPLGDLMTSAEPIKILAQTDQEKVASIFSKYNLISAPVVDEKNRLLGVILIDDIVDVISEEATEDIAKMAGTRPAEIHERSTFRIAWFRSPWLLATLVGQFLVFLVIRYFEFALTKVIALASFLPLIAAMGGNVGAQSAMICVRSMALGQLKGKEKSRAVLRETKTGMLLGLGYGVLVGVIAFVIYGGSLGIPFAIVVGLSVWVAMVMAAFTGAFGPIVLERMNIDPATAVGPMVTTTTDLLGITAYFILAVFIMIGTGV
jgi:magnesium transporter